MKILFLFTLMSASLSSFANELPLMDVKERLRISLWIEGVEDSQNQKSAPAQKRLPEELERVLRKL
jgi:hypothetical protein